MSNLPKIYIYPTIVWESGDMVCVALAEDGHALASHLSSNERYAKHDMGITGTWKRDTYHAHYPDGYELVWVDFDDVETHEGLLAAYALNQEMKPNEPEQDKVG